jgi:DNA (cytosine-5)-methyltransferase 1
MTYKIPLVKDLIINTENNNHKFEVVSLFAGGGGSSTGYRMAGGKVLAINEFIPEAIKTYKSNWSSTKIITEDIRKINGNQILKIINKNQGELDILDGSPPCSAFSTVGSREKGWGKIKQYSDSKQSNVEDLFFDYIRILREIMPKVFIAENVSGLTKGAAKGYLNVILRELRLSDYYVECKVLDAKWLGIPQSRQRTIFVGIRNDLMKENYKNKLHPKPINNIVTLKEAFNGLILNDNDKKETDLKKYAIYKLLKNMPLDSAHKKRFSLKKTHPLKYSPCITATNGNIGAANAVHWENRAFTVNEVKRIMSVPDDYILTGTYQQKVERLGRMVAPFMMKAVSENILKLGVLNGNP